MIVFQTYYVSVPGPKGDPVDCVVNLRTQCVYPVVDGEEATKPLNRNSRVHARAIEAAWEAKKGMHS